MTTILPDTTRAHVLAISWNNDARAYLELTSPIIGWEIDPGEDPRPITLLDLEGLAWAVIDQTGQGFMGDCCAHREEIVQELRRRARLLAEVNA